MSPEILSFFKSPSGAAEFALIHTDGETRQRLLGVTFSLYKNTAAANAWLKEIRALNISPEARAEAEAMHAEMIAR